MNDDLRPTTAGDRRKRYVADFRAAYCSRSFGIRVRNGAGAALLCAGLMLLPFLATLDVGVAVGCRNLGRLACLQMVARSVILPVMNELGKLPE